MNLPGRHAAPRPQPVLNAASIAGAVTAVVGAVLTVLVATGVIGQDNADNLSTALTPALTAIVGVISTIAAALKARQQVTPLQSPRNDDGTPLVALGTSTGPLV